MADTATQPRRRKPPTDGVRIDKELARKAGVIAAHRDSSLPDYLSEKLTKPIEDDYREVLREMQRDAAKK